MKYSEIAANLAVAACTQLIRKPEISIEFPPNGQRARKVISRSNAKATGKYPSWKMQRAMHYESSHERNAFKLLDACPEVISFNEQPCCIRYVMDGERYIHYPDILVILPWGKALWEVKTAADAATLEVRRRTEFMEQALPLLGYGYCVVTAEQLAQLPRLHIVDHLLRWGRSPVQLVQREQIRKIFKNNSNINLGIFKHGAEGEEHRNAIYSLILEGTLKIDFNRPLIDESPIYAEIHLNGGSSWE